MWTIGSSFIYDAYHNCKLVLKHMLSKTRNICCNKVSQIEICIPGLHMQRTSGISGIDDDRSTRELEEIFKSECDQKVEIPNLNIVVLDDLPRLFHTQGILFQAAKNRFVRDCLNYTISFS